GPLLLERGLGMAMDVAPDRGEVGVIGGEKIGRDARHEVPCVGRHSSRPAHLSSSTANFTRGDNCHPQWYDISMKTVTIRDFRTRPRAVREALSKESKALLTVNGRPLAVLLPVNAETYDRTLDVVSRAEALQLLNQFRDRAKATGRDRIGMEEIDAE